MSKLSTIPASELIDSSLKEWGFKMNGDDYWNRYAVVGGEDLEDEWEEEYYVSNTGEGYYVWYPSGRFPDKIYRTEKGLLKYLIKKHDLFELQG